MGRGVVVDPGPVVCGSSDMSWWSMWIIGSLAAVALVVIAVILFCEARAWWRRR